MLLVLSLSPPTPQLTFPGVDGKRKGGPPQRVIQIAYLDDRVRVARFVPPEEDEEAEASFYVFRRLVDEEEEEEEEVRVARSACCCWGCLWRCGCCWLAHMLARIDLLRGALPWPPEAHPHLLC